MFLERFLRKETRTSYPLSIPTDHLHPFTFTNKDLDTRYPDIAEPLLKVFLVCANLGFFDSNGQLNLRYFTDPTTCARVSWPVEELRGFIRSVALEPRPVRIDVSLTPKQSFFVCEFYRRVYPCFPDLNLKTMDSLVIAMQLRIEALKALNERERCAQMIVWTWDCDHTPVRLVTAI